MISIYCIEDINDLKYIGSTNQTLERRLQKHITANDCSSNKLNLHNCIIYELEKCEEKDRKIREQYWIVNTECVNERKAYRTKEEKIQAENKAKKKWVENNKEKRKATLKKWEEKNKDKIREKNKKYNETRKEQKREWYLKNKEKQRLKYECKWFINKLMRLDI